MKNKNLKLWDQVCVSDQKTLKKLSYGFKPTVIDAQSQVKRATEIFGPMGIGWGIEKEARHFEEGKIFYSGVLWYVLEEQRGEVAICSDVDIKNDCMKSAQTDALTKGLSRLGFNSDVFENQWDGNKYVGEPKRQPGGVSDNLKPFDDGTEGMSDSDLKKEMTGPTYQPTDKVKFGFPAIKQKQYSQCTKAELKQNYDYFKGGDDMSPEMERHLNTIEVELELRSAK